MERNYQPLLQKLSLAIQLGFNDLFLFHSKGTLQLSGSANILYAISEISYSILECTECNADIFLIKTLDGKYKARAVKFRCKRPQLKQQQFDSEEIEATNNHFDQQSEEYTPLLILQRSSARHLNLRALLTSHFLTSKKIDNEN